MATTVEIDRAAAMARIAAACPAFPEIAAAYLFGSALSRCRPDSDIDVGVIRRGPPGEDALGRLRASLALEGLLMAALGEQDGHPFEVTVLPEDQPLFVLPVLNAGRLCYIADEAALADFLENVAQGYRENAPRYVRAAREAGEERIFTR